MKDIQKYSEQTFEDIKRINEFGVECWLARELATVLEYTRWENFNKVINKSKEACLNSNINVEDHFRDVRKMVDIGSNSQRKIEDIEFSRLDHMGSTELAANLFRATQTDEKLRRGKIKGKEKANQTHFVVGKIVRETITKLGGTMPEDLPTPNESIKQLEVKKVKKVKSKVEEDVK